MHDKIGDLVARQARHCPRGKRDTVNGGNFTHTVNIRKQGGQVAKSTAVAEVYDNEQGDTNNRDFVGNCSANQRDGGKDELAYKYDLINGISIFEVIPDRGVAQSTRGVEEAGHGAKNRRDIAQTDCRVNIFFVRNERKPAGYIDIENQPNAEEFKVGENLETGEELLEVKLLVFFHPALGLFQKQVSHEHHYKPNACEDIQRFFRALRIDQRLDNGGENHFRRAEARHGKPRCQALVVFEPKHERFHGREIPKTKPDPHNYAVEQKNEWHTVQAYGKSRTRYADRKANRCDKTCFMYVFFHEIAEERRAHAEEENGERERPAEHVRVHTVCSESFLYGRAKQRPTVHGSNPAVQKQRGNRRARPFVTEFFHIRIPSMCLIH